MTTTEMTTTQPTTTTEPSPVASDDADFVRFTASLGELRETLAIPGMSAAVVRDRELVWAEGFGYADIDNGILATADTPYHLASVTKPIAATSIMQLVEEGLLDLDDAVADYGVDLPAAVQVRHLLTHTSSGTPGTVHRYDGNRYGELSKVIEAVTGKSFRTAMYERILEPVDMTETAGNFTGCDENPGGDIEAAGGAVRSAMAEPYQLNLSYQVVGSAYPTDYSAAAGLISSVVDIAKFDIALDEDRLLAPETKAEMLSPAISTIGASTDQMYGLGWYIQDYRGTRLIWHYGHWPPAISALYLKVPDHDLTFVVLANTPNLSMPFPMGEGDVLASTLAVAFYREFVFPLLHDADLPEVDWTADESTLITQLAGVTDGDARSFLERELSATRMMFSSVGRIDLVDRLATVHEAAFTESNGLSSYLVSAAAAAPEPEVPLDEASLRGVIGRYVLDEAIGWPDEEEAPPDEADVVLEGGQLVACAGDGPPLILVPVADTRFRSAPIGGEPVNVGITVDDGVVQRLTLSILGGAVVLVYDRVGGAVASVEFRSVEPEDVGFSSAALAEAAELAEEIGSAAVLAARGQDVFFDWGDTDAKLPVHSIRKPLLGAVFGIHVAAGDIDLDATLEELGIDDIPQPLTAAEKQATVRDLLMARSGVYHVAAGEIQTMRDERPERGSHPPGTFYYYNNWDFNALGTIFEQQTGMTVCEAFRIEIAEPIGMQDFTAQDCGNLYEAEFSMHPVYAFAMTALDLARFGLLYLREGRWGDEQIVPRSWIDESWTPYSTIGEAEGIYVGYLWRIASADGEVGEPIGHEVYWHTGLGVHILAVVPGLELVLVHRVDTTRDFTDPGDGHFQLLSTIMAGRE
jgi:CubicO group peptidase (beta-lactamase class C family)